MLTGILGFSLLENFCHALPPIAFGLSHVLPDGYIKIGVQTLSLVGLVYLRFNSVINNVLYNACITKVPEKRNEGENLKLITKKSIDVVATLIIAYFNPLLLPKIIFQPFSSKFYTTATTKSCSCSIFTKIKDAVVSPFITLGTSLSLAFLKFSVRNIPVIGQYAVYAVSPLEALFLGQIISSSISHFACSAHKYEELSKNNDFCMAIGGTLLLFTNFSYRLITAYIFIDPLVSWFFYDSIFNSVYAIGLATLALSPRATRETLPKFDVFYYFRETISRGVGLIFSNTGKFLLRMPWVATIKFIFRFTLTSKAVMIFLGVFEEEIIYITKKLKKYKSAIPIGVTDYVPDKILSPEKKMLIEFFSDPTSDKIILALEDLVCFSRKLRNIDEQISVKSHQKILTESIHDNYAERVLKEQVTLNRTWTIVDDYIPAK